MTTKTTGRKKLRKPKKGAEFSARRELITPKIAAQYLESLPEGQRRLRKIIVERYAMAMKAGKWKHTGEAIKFDTHGDLIDGQHRLQAVIQSGATIKCEVQRNVPDDAFMDLDTGAGRNPGDLLKIAGYKYTSNIAAIIRYLTSLSDIEAAKITPTSLAKRKCPPDTLLSYAEEHGDALMEAAKNTITKDAKQVCSPPALFGSLFFAFAEYNQKGAEQFFHLLIHGMDAEGNGFEHGRQDPVYQLRRFLLDLNTSKHKRRPQFYKAAMVIKAWNAFQEREIIGRLGYSENEQWPETNRRRSRIRPEVAANRDKKRTLEDRRRERTAHGMRLKRARAKAKAEAKSAAAQKSAATRGAVPKPTSKKKSTTTTSKKKSTTKKKSTRAA